MATEAANDFWHQFKEEYSNINQLLNQSSTLPTSNLPLHFDTILQKINGLEKRITEALSFIPSYDERQFSLQLKELSERLDTKKSELQPKAKFSFKSRKQKTTPKPTVVIKPKETGKEHVSDATVLIKDQSDKILRLDQSKECMDVLLSDLTRCIVILDSEKAISAVHMKNIRDCILFCGSIDGSLLVYGISHSVLVVGCHQLRIHDAHHLDILMHVTSRPIIEDSHNISTGKFNNQENTVNYFDQVEDFNWLKKQMSPNWKTMENDRLETLVQAIEILKSDEGLTKLSTFLPTKES
ncbi:hypothetical protein G6F56_003678 [Rhizopus delemar]|nr:hypothetical protein G6F56_003678 [Rhizopus delemar]